MVAYSSDELFEYLKSKPMDMGLDETKPFDINLLLSMIGEYQSKNYCWNQSVIYHNIEYDVTLNGCEAILTIEVSHDNFVHIEDTKEITLTDGNHFVKIEDLMDTAYVRYRIDLKSTTNNQTPRIHKLVMNVEGLDYFRHAKYMALDCIVVTVEDINYLFDALMKKGVKRNHLLDALAKKLNVKKDYVLDTLLMTMEDIGYSVDTILLMLGIYRSKIKDWGQTVDHANIEVGTTLNGCEIEVDVEVSDDNFSTIKQTTTYELNDGEYIFKLSAVQDARYTRYTIRLKSFDPGYTPRLHYLIMNVEGTGYGIGTKHFKLDMLAIDYDIKTNFALDVRLLGAANTWTLDYYLDSLLKGSGDIQYILDVLTKIERKEDVDLDTVLRNKLVLSYLLDTILKGEGYSKYDIDASLSKANIDESFNLDVYVYDGFNIPKRMLIDTLLYKEDIKTSFTKDLICKIIRQKSFLTDVLLEAKNLSNDFYMDSLIKGLDKEEYDLDTLLKKENIDESFLLDSMLKVVNKTSFDLDMIIGGITKADFDIDTLLKLDDVSTSYSLAVRLYLGMLFIDYAKPETETFPFDTTTSTLSNMSAVMTAFYVMDSGLDQFYSQLVDIVKLSITTKSTGSLCSYLNEIISGFTMDASNNTFFTMNDNLNQMFEMETDTSSLDVTMNSKTSMYNMSLKKVAAN